jgi:hypothetical protein
MLDGDRPVPPFVAERFRLRFGPSLAAGGRQRLYAGRRCGLNHLVSELLLNPRHFDRRLGLLGSKAGVVGGLPAQINSPEGLNFGDFRSPCVSAASNSSSERLATFCHCEEWS